MPRHRFTPSSAYPLTDAFQLKANGELISFTGGGGKTSLLFALSREYAAAGRHVVATTTTRIATSEVLRAPAYCLARDLVDSDHDNRGFRDLEKKLQTHHFCVVVGDLGHDKAKNVPLTLPAQLLDRPGVNAVLVEADGAKMLPIKAPASHEPAVPTETTLLVPVVGIDALSAPLQDVAHRPQLLANLLDLSLSETLTPEHVAALIASPHGGLRNAPPQARIIPFINKVENDQHLAQASEIAHRILAALPSDPRIERVIIGAVQTARPIRRIVER